MKPESSLITSKAHSTSASPLEIASVSGSTLRREAASTSAESTRRFCTRGPRQGDVGHGDTWWEGGIPKAEEGSV
jgi:hypothetical protein